MSDPDVLAKVKAALAERNYGWPGSPERTAVEALVERCERAENADHETERLSIYIIANIPGEPSQSQGAVDTMIRCYEAERQRADAAEAALRESERESQRLVDLLLGGRCVYCGEVVHPDVPNQELTDEVLRIHVEQCPKHPLAIERQRADAAEAALHIACQERDANYALTVIYLRQKEEAESERDRLRALVREVAQSETEPGIFTVTVFIAKKTWTAIQQEARVE